MPEDPELAVQEPDRRCIKEGVTWSMWRGLSCGVCDEGSRGNLLKTNEDLVGTSPCRREETVLDCEAT